MIPIDVKQGKKQTEPLSYRTAGKLSIPLLPTCTCCYFAVSTTTSFSESALRLLYWFLLCQPSLIFPSISSLCSCVFCFSTFLLLFLSYPPTTKFYFIPLSCYLSSPLSPIQPLPPSNSSLPAACLGLSELRVSAVDRAGCSISVSACLCNRRRRLSGPLSADQHRCRWEVKSSPVTRAWRQWPMVEAGPPSPLSSFIPSESVSCFIVYTSRSHKLSRSLSFSLSPALSPLLLQQQGWSGL